MDLVSALGIVAYTFGLVVALMLFTSKAGEDKPPEEP